MTACSTIAKFAAVALTFIVISLRVQHLNARAAAALAGTPMRFNLLRHWK
jgi:hypothetical protein